MDYILRNVDDELWVRLKSAAALQKMTVREVIISALELFANKHQPPLDK